MRKVLAYLWAWIKSKFGVGITEEVYNPMTRQGVELPKLVTILYHSMHTLGWWLFIAGGLSIYFYPLVGGTLLTISLVLTFLSMFVKYYQVGLWWLATLFEYLVLSAGNFLHKLFGGEGNVESICG